MAVSEEMIEHLQGNTNLACFLKITARDGTTLRVWNGTRNKILNGETYQAYPLAPTQLQQSNGLKADNMEAVVAYSGLFTAATLRSKKWLGARVEYAVYDYKDFSLGYAERRVGFLGETEVGKFSAKPELKSLSNKLSQPVTLTYQANCNVVEFADARCGVDPTGWTRSGFKIRALGTVAAPILNRQQFSIAFSEVFARGLRGRFYSGTNFGTLVREKNNAQLNFPSSFITPVPEVPFGNWSAKWEGTIRVPTTGNWNFKVIHDNGARLTVNSVSLINNWNDLGTTLPATDTGSTFLTAGIDYPIRADWNDGGPPHEFRLFWSSASQPEQIVPASALTPPPGTNVADKLYERGKIKFLTGANAGSEMQILVNSGNALTLYLPLYYTPQIGDQIELTTGCNREIETCVGEYGNGANNRSFFTLPGRNKLTFPE